MRSGDRDKAVVDVQNDFMEYMAKLREFVKDIVQNSKQTGKTAIFSIATTSNVNKREILFPSARETDKTICGNILLNSGKNLEKIIKEIDGNVEIILVDAETKIPDVVDLESRTRSLAKKAKYLLSDQMI